MGSYNVVVSADDTLFADTGPDALGGGAGSALAALTDASDATYIEETETAVDDARIYLLTGDVRTGLPAGALITGIRAYIRASVGATTFDQVAVFARTVRNALGDVIIGQMAPTDRQGVAHDMFTTGSVVEAVGQVMDSVLVSPPHGGLPINRYVHDVFSLGNARIGVEVTINGTSAGPLAMRIMRAGVRVQYNEKPTVTATHVGGSTPASRPRVSWTYADAEGDAQEAYQIRVFTEAQYTVSGFTADNTVPVWDSGKVISSATSAQVGMSLTNGTKYRAYVRVYQTRVLGRDHFSNWAQGAEWTIAIEPPATPLFLPIPEAVNGRYGFILAGQDNMLTAQQSSLEDSALGVTGWTAGTNTSIARSTTQASHGSASLRLTRNTSTGDAVAGTLFESPLVLAGSQYTARAEFRAATTPRSCCVQIVWFNAFLGVISTSEGTNVADTTSGWTTCTVSASAPVGAVFAAVNVVAKAAVATEEHYVDRIGMKPGGTNPTAWSMGGLVATSFTTSTGSYELLQRWHVERLDNGVWVEIMPELRDLEFDPRHQQTAFYDSGMLHGIATQYRVWVSSVAEGSYAVDSAKTAGASFTVPMTAYWLKCQRRPDLNTTIRASAPVRRTRDKPGEFGYAIGDKYVTVSHDGLKAGPISLEVQTLNETALDKLMALVDCDETLLLYDVLGNRWYVEVIRVTSQPRVALPAPGESTPVRNFQEHSIELVEVETY